MRGNICRCTGYVNIVVDQVDRDRSGGVMTATHACRDPAVGRASACPRVEDRRLLKGQGEFADDVWMHRQGYAHFVRSPHGHARIVSVDVSRALRWTACTRC